MEKTERFNMALTPEDKAALQRLAARERIPAAAVVRRLIWNAARQETPARGVRIVTEHEGGAVCPTS